MRLIDADRLLSDYSYLFMDIYGKECAKMFVGIVNQAQTIDVGGELEKVKAEIEENGVWVRYNIEGRTDRDIENIVEAVLKQAKESFIYRLDKHIAELKGE